MTQTGSTSICIETGHSRDRDNYNLIAQQIMPLRPRNPCLDGELVTKTTQRFDRRTATSTNTMCAKALTGRSSPVPVGHTYGCHDIWQFYNPEHLRGIVGTHSVARSH
jgi:hypothetical protein